MSDKLPMTRVQSATVCHAWQAPPPARRMCHTRGMHTARAAPCCTLGTKRRCAVPPERAAATKAVTGVPPGRRRSTVEASDDGGGERATPAASDNG